jgi:hypothetical protein
MLDSELAGRIEVLGKLHELLKPIDLWFSVGSSSRRCVNSRIKQ